jgi:hypothetical protein
MGREVSGAFIVLRASVFTYIYTYNPSISTTTHSHNIQKQHAKTHLTRSHIIKNPESAVFIEDRLQTLLGVLDHPDPCVKARSDLLLAGCVTFF